MTVSPHKQAETWVDEHADILFQYAMQRVYNSATAEDLVQDTFLAAIKGYDSFKEGSSIRTWLVGILKHKTIDYIRAKYKRNPAQTISPDDPVVDGMFNANGSWINRPGNWNADPSVLVEKQEFWGVLSKCLKDLPERIRESFCLRVMEDMKSDEVCKVLGIQSTNLWVILHRARSRLRLCLEANWFEQEN